MQYDRRSMIAGSIVLSMTSAVGPAFGQPVDAISVEGMEKLDDFPAGFQDGLFRAPDPNKNFGATPPPAIYSAIGSALMRGAPTDCRPVDVAYYFASLREGKVPPAVLEQVRAIAAQAVRSDLAEPDFLKFFAYDWEQNTYFNPVVVGFFKGNGLKPYAGDETPWCAAFANWCISRSRVRQANEIVFSSQIRTAGTQSASSGSFRCWGAQATTDPREGDVIVWAKAGTVTGKCPTVGQGHVAFVTAVEQGADGRPRYHVVGGNQGFRGSPVRGAAGAIVKPQDVAQAVSRRVIGPTFGDRVLHSIRTEAFLR